MRSVFLRKLLILCAAALLFAASSRTAHAVPILQLYVEGGTYDDPTDTWEATSSTGDFRIWAIGNTTGPGSKGSIYDVKLSVVYDGTLSPTITLAGSQVTGFPLIADPSIAAPASAPTFHTGGVPLLGDGSPLPSHGEYTATTKWQEFKLGDFTLSDATLADFSGVTAFPTTFYANKAQINVYSVHVTGLGAGQTVHFDLYDHVGSATKAKYVFAPFSHDAEGVGGTDTHINELPEPASLTLLLTGAVGATIIGRRRQRWAA